MVVTKLLIYIYYVVVRKGREQIDVTKRVK